MSSGTRDRNEVRRLYEVHGRALLAYACAFLGPSQAEDVLHHNDLRGRSREVALDGDAQWLEGRQASQ